MSNHESSALQNDFNDDDSSSSNDLDEVKLSRTISAFGAAASSSNGDEGVVGRRVAAMRPSCPFGMDRVGEHTVTLQEWITHVHEISPVTTSASPRFYRSRTSENKSGTEMAVTDDSFPYGVTLTSGAEQALRGLNYCVHMAYQKQFQDEDEHKLDHAGDVDSIVESVARIPSLMKTILLIEDDDDRRWVMSTPIIRRVMLCRFSVANNDVALEEKINLGIRVTVLASSLPSKQSWISFMFYKRGARLTELSLHYLQTISNLTVEDYLSVRHLENDTNATSSKEQAPTNEDIEEFEKLKNSLYSTISEIPYLIVYIYQNGAIVERASVTDAVQYIMNDVLSQPFSLGIIFLSLVCRIILKVAFYVTKLSGSGFAKLIFTLIGQLSAYVLVFIIVSQDLLTLEISWKFFINEKLKFWHLTHLSYAILALIYFYSRDRNDTFGAIVAGVGWLDLIGFLRIFHWKLATLTLALTQIMKDLVLFVFILLLFILGFGEMLHFIIKDNGDTCSDSENQFCEGLPESYLAVYQLIVGDVSVDNYRLTPLTVLLFVALTFFGILIMLTVIISIVDESYDKSKTKAKQLFGRARLTLVASILLLGAEEPNQGSLTSGRAVYTWKDITSIRWKDVTFKNSKRLGQRISFATGLFVQIFRILVEISLATADELRTRISNTGAVAITVITSLPFYAIAVWILFITITGWGWDEKLLKKSCPLYYIVHTPVKFISFLFLGLGAEKRKERDEWRSRLEHFDKSIEGAKIKSGLDRNRTKEAVDVKEILDGLQRSMRVQEEKRIAETEKLRNETKELKRHTEELRNQNEELKDQISSMEQNIISLLNQTLSVSSS